MRWRWALVGLFTNTKYLFKQTKRSVWIKGCGENQKQRCLLLLLLLLLASLKTQSFIHLLQIPPFPPFFPLPFLGEEWKEKKTVHLQQIKTNKGSKEFVSSVVADLDTSLHSVKPLFSLVIFWLRERLIWYMVEEV